MFSRTGKVIDFDKYRDIGRDHLSQQKISCEKSLK